MQRGSRSMLLLAAALLIAAPLCNARLSFKCTTPKSSTDKSKPNTFIGTAGSQIATSLLASGTPAMLWGIVPSSSIRAACDQIVNTGTHTVQAAVSGDDWGDSAPSYNIQLQLVATGGCNAAADNSGTEFVFTNPAGRKIALVCPTGAGTKGCGIYLTGSDVTSLYDLAKPSTGGRRLQSTSANSHSRKMLDCSGGAGAGAAVTGVAAGSVAGALGESAACLALGPFAPLCVAGVVGVSAAVGAGIGCAVDQSCFPGNSRVLTEMGEYRTMNQLAVGDKVAALGLGNKVTYEEIYAFGHQDAETHASMVALQLQDLQQAATLGPQLTLSPLHFLPLVTGVQKRAEDVELGDLVWAQEEGSQRLLPHNVTGISRVVEQGLYNPLTLGGTIIVDGVAASVHSDWFLDSLFDRLGLTAMLPAAYQAVLAPARGLFYMLGKEQYVSLYQFLDKHIDLAVFGTAYGGRIAATTGVSLLLAAVMASTAARKTKA